MTPKKPSYEELHDDLEETEGLRQRLIKERDGLKVQINSLQSQLREALHNKAELEFQLRARLCVPAATDTETLGS